MAKKTTVKPISLKYGDVGSGCEVKLMGVLKGLTIGQDEPDSTEIEAEFFDAPFDIFYDGNPVTFNFELANYSLDELPALFGGSYDAETDTYEGAANAFTSEHSWELEFQRGVASLYLYRGLTLGTIKKDEDGALNYAVTITALNWTDSEDTEHMYKIKSTRAKTYAIPVKTNNKRGIVVTGHTTMDVDGQTVGAVTCSDGSVLPVKIDNADSIVWGGSDNISNIDIKTLEYVTVADDAQNCVYINPQLIPLLYDAGARFGEGHAMQPIGWATGDGQTRLPVTGLHCLHESEQSVLSVKDDEAIVLLSGRGYDNCLNCQMTGFVEFGDWENVVYFSFTVNRYIAIALGVPESVIDGQPRAVDLGLPSGTLWADRNVGAKHALDNGLFFSWGNVKGVTLDHASDMTEAAYAGTPGSTLTGDIVQGGANDAAHVNMGGKWVMPTQEQWIELLNNCNVSTNGNAVVITQNDNKQRLVLPALMSIHDGQMGGSGWWLTVKNTVGTADDAYKDNGWYGFNVLAVQNAS